MPVAAASIARCSAEGLARATVRLWPSRLTGKARCCSASAGVISASVSSVTASSSFTVAAGRPLCSASASASESKSR
jgi:hypothetical protein